MAESLAFKKFCVASNAASIPEIAGELIDYVDPLDVAGWADALRFWSTHPAQLQRREKKIAARFVPARWAETAAAIVAVAQKSSGGPP